MAKPPSRPRVRQLIPPPESVAHAPPKPRFQPSEVPTKPNRNANVARWAVISELLPGLDAQAIEILTVVADALANMPPTEHEPLLNRFDAMGPRQRLVFGAVVQALAAPE